MLVLPNADRLRIDLDELGERILNPAEGDALFRPRARATTRVMRPGALYAEIPPRVFEDLAARLPAPLLGTA